MAVPGSPLDPRAQGCNQLIRDGATLVQNASDVIVELRPMESRVAAPKQRFEAAPAERPDDAVLRAVEELLGPSPGRRDHPPVWRVKRRGADGLARARPRRTPRPPRWWQSEPAFARLSLMQTVGSLSNPAASEILGPTDDG